jgi:hypothetical protein
MFYCLSELQSYYSAYMYEIAQNYDEIDDWAKLYNYYEVMPRN